jgi:type 1 fimbria pilin
MEKRLPNKPRLGGGAIIFALFACLTASWHTAVNAQAVPRMNQCFSQGAQQLSFPRIQATRDAPNGSTLSEARTLTYTFRCEGDKAGNGPFRPVGSTILRASGTVSNVWETGTPGIGIRVTDVARNDVLSRSHPTSFFTFGPTIPRGRTGTAQIRFQLIKTGRITTTQVQRVVVFSGFRTYDTRRANSYGNVSPAATLLATPITVAQTCRVTTPNFSVPLPDALASALGTNGAAFGNAGFSIGLQCNTRANVHITLTDVTTPGNRSDLLTLTSDSTARNVRLRIRNPSNTPVRFGRDSSAAGNANQWRVGSLSGASTIRMSAEYVATGAATAGTVRALATFTMSYQ